jgi:hypothetical protein
VVPREARGEMAAPDGPGRGRRRGRWPRWPAPTVHAAVGGTTAKLAPDGPPLPDGHRADVVVMATPRWPGRDRQAGPDGRPPVLVFRRSTLRRFDAMAMASRAGGIWPASEFVRESADVRPRRSRWTRSGAAAPTADGPPRDGERWPAGSASQAPTMIARPGPEGPPPRAAEDDDRPSPDQGDVTHPRITNCRSKTPFGSRRFSAAPGSRHGSQPGRGIGPFFAHALFSDHPPGRRRAGIRTPRIRPF